MRKETIINAVNKIIKTKNPIVTRLKHEDSDNYYNVWKIEDNNKTYIFKQVNDIEADIYSKVKVSALPKCFGVIDYYNKKYILIEYIDGNNLMKADRDSLIKVLDAIISIQKLFWDKMINIGYKYEDCKNKVLNRKNYLYDEILEEAFDKFYNKFMTCARTLTHEDLLPFNVIVNDEKAFLIDWEYGGILPYPMMITRLIAHTKDDKNYLFYMKTEDIEFAIDYYYEKFIKDYNIDKLEYSYTIDCFMFYESIEWIFVYNKHNMIKDDRFNYYYSLANYFSKKIINN